MLNEFTFISCESENKMRKKPEEMNKNKEILSANVCTLF